MSHIFISYSKKDIDFARHLRKLLQDKGFAVWMDDTKLVPSQKWWSSIEANIKTCAALLVIMSPNSQESEWVERELLVAEEAEHRKPIFPVLLAGKRWARLANIQYEDMTTGEDVSGLSSDFVDALQRVAPTFSGVSAPPPLPINFQKSNSNQSQNRLIATLGFLAVIVVAALLITPPILENLENTKATNTAQAATELILALTPTLNPVEQVQTLDARATTDAEMIGIARQTMTAQAILDFNASATAQTTLDAEASAIDRINLYGTATALASITPSPTITSSPTNTEQPTNTATQRPTRTVIPTPTQVPPDAILFSENFEDGVANDILVRSGSWNIIEQNGNKFIQATTDEWWAFISLGSNDWENYAIEGRFQWLEINPGDPAGRIDIGIRTQSEGLINNYVLFIDPDAVGLYRRFVDENARWNQTEDEPTFHMLSTALDVSDWNTFHVEIINNNDATLIRTWINGRRFPDVLDNDSPYRQGDVTLGVIAQTVVAFDNILVWEINN